MKKKSTTSGFVYSTNPAFMQSESDTEQETPAPANQPLRILLDKKQRAGKQVTLIEGFIGVDADLQHLTQKLKNTCGTGGSAKDGLVLLQGDHREKVLRWLQQNGYTQSRIR
jgi:translation initiation factor 1